ncbi:translation initiation factor [Rhodococcus sp. WMMA185]|uniref:DUF6319 family protein n=1 Tax=Rhodococcus sp. WMMA185 TaxID=679318 RepID=UPI000879157D|nr:DUF6319 family protein [Rhodococcus sp. WMMA185]AOW91669.1 translation initiation factor [Rhodococcus sp. WMMA185]
MPPRRRSDAGAPDHLTAENLETITTAIKEGKRATVYLREAMPSLGLEAGTSAKVISVQGNTVVIRPKGVNDELPFEAEELLMSRIPAPKPVAASGPAVYQGIEPGPAATPKAPAPKTAAASQAVAPSSSPTPSRRTAKKVPAGVSVTIHAGADNDWSVTVATGAKKPGKAIAVAPDAVERAVRELGEESAIEAVESVIVAARNLAAARVDELTRQLEDARKALESLGAGE